jgi:hypothetical protein
MDYPVCSARYKKFIKKKGASEALYDQLTADNDEVSIVLDNEIYTIDFAIDHLSKLRAIIKESQENAS